LNSKLGQTKILTNQSRSANLKHGDRKWMLEVLIRCHNNALIIAQQVRARYMVQFCIHPEQGIALEIWMQKYN
jgi:tRNA pseudouridine-54 N-methylase